ncbi:protein rhomboid-like [Mytilus edulis]|uniref:protein rhomboid-like n=1 Tax=Mytilus edulis TaxID=6550 RepID=UPI0039F05B93
MAVHKPRVAFKDVTPGDEQCPIPSITQSVDSFDSSSKTTLPSKPAVRPKLRLNLPGHQPYLPSALQPPISDFRFGDSDFTFTSRRTPVLSMNKPYIPTTSKTNIISPVFEPIAKPLHSPTVGRHGLELHFDKDSDYSKTEVPSSRRKRSSVSREPNDIDNAYIESLRKYQVDNWRHFFEWPGSQKSGEIRVEEIRRLLRNPLFVKDMDTHTIEVLQMKCMEPERRSMTYQELVDLMSNKRTPSFRLAVDGQSKETLACLSRKDRTTFFQVMVRAVARNFLTDDVERQYYADRYNCCPPPIFVPVITLIEIALFAYYCVENGNINHNGPLPVESVLIYRPDKRVEFWRFLCYTFIHAGWVHLIFNMVVQIAVGIPLEMIHGCLRTGMVYMSGVLAGSLGTSVFDMEAYLVGASGGVYALLAAHLANIVLNYSNMELGIVKLAAVLIIASADVGFAIWDRYSSEVNDAPVGYTAHLMGALAGLTIGLVVLKNFEQKLHDQYIWWIALAVYLGCIVFAICWNVLYY